MLISIYRILFACILIWSTKIDKYLKEFSGFSPNSDLTVVQLGYLLKYQIEPNCPSSVLFVVPILSGVIILVLIMLVVMNSRSPELEISCEMNQKASSLINIK